MIKTVLFDYVSTLVEMPANDVVDQACFNAALPLYNELAASTDAKVEDLVQSLDQEITRQAKLHRMSFPEQEGNAAALVQAALSRLQLPIDMDWINRLNTAAQRAIQAELRVASSAREVLAELKSAGYQLGLVSNDIYPAPEALAALQRHGLYSLLDTCVFSAAVGWRKPNAAIFERALTALQATPQNTVMVGDLLSADIAGAKALGCRTVQTIEFHHDLNDQVAPDAVIKRLDELLPLLDNWGAALVGVSLS